MGSELLTESLPAKKTMAQIFWDAFPAYLAMGMSSDDYWNGDAQLCVAYRKAYTERLDLQDAMLWRQGLYVYHALCAVAPYFNSIKPQRPEAYLAEPFGIVQKTEEKQKPDLGLEYMKAWAERFNANRTQNNGRKRT